ncbi:Transcription factor IIS N-terminal protein [Dioscorea alata]|uniref:Transcription factor IIS N-terminal protein n=1 Tax=Dioscorea alata TaxID=55571 RepID=A0ACB7VSC7_DIOAL|nr:Transcription factor IIS N-terminal protein [Dioscorea alata]
MDPNNIGEVLRTYNVDLWSLIDVVIVIFASDLPREHHSRRDSIVKCLYLPEPSRCRSCTAAGEDLNHRSSDVKEISSLGDSDADERDLHGDQDQSHRINLYRPIDSEQRRILTVKELGDPDQNDEVLVNCIRKLIDMNFTFKALKETDIRRHVNELRKHPSGEVWRLVKLLVRKWNDLADGWVRSNSNTADSPQQMAGKMNQNEHQLVDLDYSPNHHTGGLVLESESRVKNIPRRDAPPKLSPPATVQAVKDEKDGLIDPERLAD